MVQSNISTSHGKDTASETQHAINFVFNLQQELMNV